MDDADTIGLEKTWPMISLTDDSLIPTDNDYVLDMPSQTQDDSAATPMEHIPCDADLLEGELVDESNNESDEDTLYHTKYELRPQARTYDNGVMSTWIDKDETGDYDPVEESRRLNRRAPKRKPQAKAQAPPACDRCSEGPNEDCVSESTISRLMVELKFTDKQEFRIKLEEIAQPTDLEIEHDFGSRRLRKRETQTTVDDKCNVNFADLNDQHGRLGHLEGHPAARGCRQCLQLGGGCSLLDDERDWPCTACTSSKESECELIIAPTYKAPCEACTKRKVTCSYAVTLDHSGPCVNCALYEKSRCVAGPLTALLRPRIDCDRNLSLPAAAIAAFCDNGLDAAVLPKQRVFTPMLMYSCKSCNEAGRQCSFMGNAEEEECTSCQINREICLKQLFTGHTKKSTQTKCVETQPVSRNRPESATKRRASVSANPTPPTKIRKLAPVNDSAPEHKTTLIIANPSPTISPASKSKTKQISTKLSHPIAFNYDVANASIAESRPCHFCSPIHFAYPILGIGHLRVIDVYDDPAKGGLIELKPSLHEPTRMCVSCTTSRLNIIKCTTHHLIPIDVTTLDVGGAFTNLFRPAHRMDTTRRERWCSLCPNLATSECVKSTGAAGKQEKCGLALCPTCLAELNSAPFEGDLKAMLGGLHEEWTERRPLGLRADWALLKRDGLLVRFITCEVKSKADEKAKEGH